MLTNVERLAIATDRARALVYKTRSAIHSARRMVIDAQHLIDLSRSTRRTAAMLRNHHFLPR